MSRTTYFFFLVCKIIPQTQIFFLEFEQQFQALIRLRNASQIRILEALIVFSWLGSFLIFLPGTVIVQMYFSDVAEERVFRPAS